MLVQYLFNTFLPIEVHRPIKILTILSFFFKNVLIGHEKKGSVPDSVQILTTFLMVASNSLFLCISTFLFVKMYLFDRKQAKHRKRTRLLGNRSIHWMQQVVPTGVENQINSSGELGFDKQASDNGSGNEDKEDDDENGEDFNHENSKRHRRQTSVHSTETVAEAHAIHDDFHESEKALQAKHRKKQQKQRRSTQLRVMARSKIRQTKALTKVPLFSNIPQGKPIPSCRSICCRC